MDPQRELYPHPTAGTSDAIPDEALAIAGATRRHGLLQSQALQTSEPRHARPSKHLPDAVPRGGRPPQLGFLAR